MPLGHEVPPYLGRALLALLLGLGCDAQLGRGHEVWDPAATKSPPRPDADEADPDPPAGGAGDEGGGGAGGARVDAAAANGDRPDARRSLDSDGGAGPSAEAGAPDVTAAPAACTLTFTVTTVTFKGDYAPDNVGVIWIADANDKFVKTLKVWAAKRRTYLDTWKKASASNTVDAVTSATASGHAARTVTWNCTDVKEQIVPDGDYRVRVQFTEEDASGKLMAPVQFTKNGAPVDLTPPDQANFKLIHLQVGP